MLRIGCVKYLNARPLIDGWPGKVVLDHPSALCTQLARGDLEVALVSSFEFLRNPIYKIVDGVSISSDGPVYSVILACADDSPTPEIEADPASETSIVLLHYLLKQRGKLFRMAKIGPDLLSPLERKRWRLLIGDHAIRFRRKFGDTYNYLDLGAEWKQVTKLPFVFALWLIRSEVVDPKSIADRLRGLRDLNLARLDNVIAGQKELDPAFCDRYYRHHLRFSFGEREKTGLLAFAELCQESELLPRREIALRVV